MNTHCDTVLDDTVVAHGVLICLQLKVAPEESNSTTGNPFLAACTWQSTLSLDETGVHVTPAVSQWEAGHAVDALYVHIG